MRDVALWGRLLAVAGALFVAVWVAGTMDRALAAADGGQGSKRDGGHGAHRDGGTSIQGGRDSRFSISYSD